MAEPKQRALITRRQVLGAGIVLALAGCARNRQTSAPSTEPSPASARPISRTEEFAALEGEYGARLGVWALDTDGQLTIGYRDQERFAFCSTVKAFLAAAVLNQRTLPQLDEVVHYQQTDVVANSPITKEQVATGMTWRQLCDAAVRFSDNTAANLLFSDIGGPAGAGQFIRSIGDDTTDISRIEPELNTAIPGDVRDTTTPRAWGQNLQKTILGNVLAADRRALLTDWMVHNTTGDKLIRSVVPEGWQVGDKTGGGDYGTRNDIAVIWPPQRGPIVLAILTSRPQQDASLNDNDPLVAQAAKLTLDALQ